MTTTVKAGSLKVKFHNALAAVVEFLGLATVTIELQCLECGAAVAPSNAASHYAYFHPEEAPSTLNS